MKKKLFAAILTFGLISSMSACNYKVVDTTYNWAYAIVSFPNGDLVEGKVESWRDYEDGDQIQVTIDSVTYLVHATDIVLMTKEPDNR